MKKVYLIFDCRYRDKPSDAIAFEMCDTLAEAQENAPDYGEDCVIVEYEDHGNELKNPIIKSEENEY